MMDGALALPEVSVGKIEASGRRGPATTAVGCEPILHVPTRWRVASAHFLIHFGQFVIGPDVRAERHFVGGYALYGGRGHDMRVIADRLQGHLGVELGIEKVEVDLRQLFCVFEDTQMLPVHSER
jgi:hypothetical protein